MCTSQNKSNIEINRLLCPSPHALPCLCNTHHPINILHFKFLSCLLEITVNYVSHSRITSESGRPWYLSWMRVRLVIGKLTTLDMTPLGWLGCKTSTQNHKADVQILRQLPYSRICWWISVLCFWYIGTALNLTPFGWLGGKTSSQTQTISKSASCSVLKFLYHCIWRLAFKENSISLYQCKGVPWPCGHIRM